MRIKAGARLIAQVSFALDFSLTRDDLKPAFNMARPSRARCQVSSMTRLDSLLASAQRSAAMIDMISTDLFEVHKLGPPTRRLGLFEFPAGAAWIVRRDSLRCPWTSHLIRINSNPLESEQESEAAQAESFPLSPVGVTRPASLSWFRSGSDGAIGSIRDCRPRFFLLQVNRYNAILSRLIMPFPERGSACSRSSLHLILQRTNSATLQVCTEPRMQMACRV